MVGRAMKLEMRPAGIAFAARHARPTMPTMRPREDVYNAPELIK